jgi:hypothetical protein
MRKLILRMITAVSSPIFGALCQRKIKAPSSSENINRVVFICRIKGNKRERYFLVSFLLLNCTTTTFTAFFAITQPFQFLAH